MTAYNQVSQQIEQAEAMMREAEARLGNFQSIRPALADLVGRGEAADGQVAVEWNTQGLAELELNPRVMRMPSVDLAEAIKEAIRSARADLSEKTRAVMRDAGVGNEPAPSIDEVRAQLGRLREQTVDTARQTVSGLDQAMQYRQTSGR
ncbi:MAG TPA: hypothetical protein VH373_24035 [Jatrophihabitantaceae bacterium]|jgi:DNA-binding protein YbaB